MPLPSLSESAARLQAKQSAVADVTPEAMEHRAGQAEARPALIETQTRQAAQAVSADIDAAQDDAKGARVEPKQASAEAA